MWNTLGPPNAVACFLCYLYSVVNKMNSKQSAFLKMQKKIMKNELSVLIRRFKIKTNLVTQRYSNEKKTWWKNNLKCDLGHTYNNNNPLKIEEVKILFERNNTKVLRQLHRRNSSISSSSDSESTTSTLSRSRSRPT